MSAQYIVRPATAFSLTSGKAKNPRKQEGQHLAFIRSLPCAVCGSYVRVHAAHLRSPSLLYAKSSAGLQNKPDDAWTTPLCAAHHTEGDDAQHKGNELEFWARFGIDPFGLCLALYRASGNEEQALLILSEFRKAEGGTGMTRAEHLAWCKKRALEYVDAGDAANAVASMMSDMDKHPDTKLGPGNPLAMLGMMAVMSGSMADVRRFVEGFN